MIKREDCRIEVECLPEVELPEDAFKSGEPDQDAEDCREIRRKLEEGSSWAWCCAQVRVTFHGLTATDHLGGCSYDSEEDFRASGYFEQMVGDCLEMLQRQADELMEALRPVPPPNAPKIKQGQIVVQAVTLLRNTPGMQWWDVDCRSKYPSVGCTSAAMVTLVRSEHTLRAGDSEEMTEIELPLDPGWSIISVDAGRYNVTVIAARDLDPEEQSYPAWWFDGGNAVTESR